MQELDAKRQHSVLLMDFQTAARLLLVAFFPVEPLHLHLQGLQQDDQS